MTELESRIAIAAIDAGERDGASLADYITENAALSDSEKNIWPVLLNLVRNFVLDVWPTGAINRAANPTSPRSIIKLRFSKGPHWPVDQKNIENGL
jgi:hypothetical protein